MTGYEYFINIFPLFSQYLEKLLLPINLNAMYVIHPIFSIFEMRGVVSVAITAAFVVFSVIALKKRNAVFLSSLFIAVPLLPALYMYPSLGISSFAERYLYLPSFGFVILIALILSWTQANNPKLNWGLNIITILAIGLYSFGTISRNAVWKDEYTLFRDTATKSPDSPHVRNNLGLAYADQGRTYEAINEFKTLLYLYPDFVEGYYNLGLTYATQGRIDEAINEFKTVLKLNSGHAKSHHNLGVAYAAQGRIDEAISEYQAAIKIDPGDAKAHNNLGVAYAAQGKSDEAISEFKATLKIKPDDVMARQRLDFLLKK